MFLYKIISERHDANQVKIRTDTTAELELVREQALAAGADAAVISNHWAKGGAGAVDLAKAVIQVCEGPSKFKFLYDLDKSIEEKISIIARDIYGAEGVTLSETAQKQVETYTAQGYSNLPSECYLAITKPRGIADITSLYG